MNVSFVELMNSGQDYTCTFMDEEGGMRTQGTVYTEADGKNFRGDFQVTEANGDMYDSHVIRVGNINYIWTSKAAQGFTMELSEGETSLFGTSDTQGEVGVSENEPMEFMCEAWTADAQMFTAPTDREFVDMDEMMRGMMEGMNGMNMSAGAEVSAAAQLEDGGMQIQQCLACDQIPDASAKAQCKAALGC